MSSIFNRNCYEPDCVCARCENLEQDLARAEQRYSEVLDLLKDFSIRLRNAQEIDTRFNPNAVIAIFEQQFADHLPRRAKKIERNYRQYAKISKWETL